MRRVTFTKTITLNVIFDSDFVQDDPALHEITFNKGEVVDLYEWGWNDQFTNFATDNPDLIARIVPGNVLNAVVCIQDVPYDSQYSEPALPIRPWSFQNKVIAKPRRKILEFPGDSGFHDDEDLIDSHPAVTSRS